MEDNNLEQSWYTKYRPKTMDEYSGPAIKKMVERRFKTKSDMPHVIMISGTRGCGKTTFARIISKYYLCEHPNEDGTPCEQCEMCLGINETLIAGESGIEAPGVVEVDATIANGKEAIQEVMDDAMLAPIYGSFKVLIMDECHMFSNAAQNSLLKLIEDIPQHLVVIFATTDPQKVLDTIKSRCQLRLEARKQSVSDMAHRLEQIAILENLEYSKEALETIARKGNRVPRECINLLENIAKTYDRKVLIEQVKEALGGATSELYMEYFEAANKSLSSILVFIKKLRDEDVKLNSFVSGLMGFVLDSMYIKHGISLEDYTNDYIKSVKALFDMYNSSDFDVLLQIIEYLSNQLTVDDDNKNELLLTTTAMRISKISLLANGLAGEQNEAIVENKISLVEHKNRKHINNENAIEVSRSDMDMQETLETFGRDTVKQVAGTQDLFSQVMNSLGDLPSLDADDENTHSEKSVKLSDDAEEFLNGFATFSDD